MTIARAGALAVLLLSFWVSPALGDQAKRVLIVHSFGTGAPPFTTHSTAFAATIAKEMGEPVDLDEISLGMARYPQPELEGAYVEFLAKRLEKWRPDLVAPVGSPAGRFVAKYRRRLFGQTPVVYTGMDRRTLPADTLSNNATFVGESFDLPGLVEDILQLQPDTQHIAVVVGATPLERFWTKVFKDEFARFSDRVTFTWFNDLSFDQMLARAAAMPPRSFILVGLLLRDAKGVTYNQDDAIVRLHAVANAPINGMYQNQIGLGIVGGRLYQGELEGVEAARVAIRILRGAPAASFPPRIIHTQRPRYDWRELRRWGISEDRLPPGSVIEFRAPTLWQEYRRWIVGIAVVGLIEAGLIVLLAVNLTRRRRVERALRESEGRVQLAADSARAGLWSLDFSTGRVWTTPRVAEILAVEPGTEWTYASFLERIHPEDRERIARALEASVREGGELDVEYRILLADGAERWISTRGRYDGGGSSPATHWSGASVDITARKLGEERLLESELRFRTVADSAPVLIWMAGLDKGCTFFNKPWLDFTGRTAEQEMGDGWTAGVHPEDLTSCVNGYRDAFDARRPFVLEFRLRRHDGEYRRVSDHGVPRYDAQGRFAGYIGSCEDITERLRAEEKFRQVFEAAPSAMIMADEGGRIVLANAQAEKLFGYSREELGRQSIHALVPLPLERRPSMWREELDQAPESRAMEAGRNVVARRKDGAEVPVEVGLSPVVTEQGVFVVASAIDISERRRAELEAESLRRDLAHISRVTTMGELTAAIVHELSQPLTAIRTNAQAGLRLLASGKRDARELEEILEDIVAADARAGQVIQQMRALFKKGESERRPLLLNNLVHDVISLVAGDAFSRSVSVSLDLAPRLASVLGDRVQLQQVLLNLVMNAFDAMRDCGGGRMTVRTRALSDRWVQLDVADTGLGIPADKVEAIFEPFVSTKPTGMGMGLSVSRTIVRAHGGRIWAENDPEGGAVIHVALPADAGRE
ncbi:MAG TPA: PAS domain S-box protein [Methylomirabilota bacterium]|nr:PAS domain S-box protein [Methylomirabilota bacterium]